MIQDKTKDGSKQNMFELGTPNLKEQKEELTPSYNK